MLDTWKYFKTFLYLYCNSIRIDICDYTHCALQGDFNLENIITSVLFIRMCFVLNSLLCMYSEIFFKLFSIFISFDYIAGYSINLGKLSLAIFM